MVIAPRTTSKPAVPVAPAPAASAVPAAPSAKPGNAGPPSKPPPGPAGRPPPTVGAGPARPPPSLAPSAPARTAAPTAARTTGGGPGPSKPNSNPAAIIPDPPAPSAPAPSAAAAKPPPRSTPPAPPPQSSAPPRPGFAVPEGIDADFAFDVDQRSNNIASLDYFEVLRLTSKASPADIKRAYHQESRKYHPDRFFNLPDQTFRESVDRLYKRINEAYVVLRDDWKRAKYVADMAGPNRAQKLRFTEESEVEAKVAAKKEREEEIGKTPQGRKFFDQGTKDFAAGRFVDAHRNFKMAMTYEPSNERYKERFKEAERNLPKSDFKIR